MKLLKVSMPTIDRWHKTGKLKGVKIGNTVMFRRTDVDALLESFAEQ